MFLFPSLVYATDVFMSSCLHLAGALNLTGGRAAAARISRALKERGIGLRDMGGGIQARGYARKEGMDTRKTLEGNPGKSEGKPLSSAARRRRQRRRGMVAAVAAVGP